MLSEQKIIEVHGLTKKFGKLTAVDHLELNVYRGDVFGFLGPNGAGKSTTIRMLLSLVKPTSGSIQIFGKPLSRERARILRRIGAIVEKSDFYLYLSAYKNLEILARISGIAHPEKRIREILELVRLTDRAHSKVKTFSHGMKQRLGIAQALLHDPELIILDEPSTGLDPRGVKEVRDLIFRLSKEEGKTIFISSHILKEIEQVANRLLIINKGAAQVEGTVEELLNSEQLSVTFEVDSLKKALKTLEHSQWISLLESARNNRLEFKLAKKSIPELTDKLVREQVKISAIIPRRSLEDYFLKITQGDL